MAVLIFRHPAPVRPRSRIWPVFLSFLGCPASGSGRPPCIYCAQDAQTGESLSTPQDIHAALERELRSALDSGVRPLEIGFYGGTFTALPGDWPERFVALAADFRRQGLITRIRCSTRPDAVTSVRLETLARLGLDLVELGVQTFDAPTLLRAGRTYAPQDALTACARVQASGLALGLQLLPGLPGHTPDLFRTDIRACIDQSPEFLRIYPCLVMAGTPLAALWRSGRYAPLELTATVEMIAAALLDLWAHGLDAIRIGLPPQPEMFDRLLAGPWHPALGSLCRGLALIRHIESLNVVAMVAPRRYASDLLGPGRANAARLARMGLHGDRLKFHDGEEFVAETA